MRAYLTILLLMVSLYSQVPDKVPLKDVLARHQEQGVNFSYDAEFVERAFIESPELELRLTQF